MSKSYLLQFEVESQFEAAVGALRKEMRIGFEAYSSHETDPEPEHVEGIRFIKIAAIFGALIGFLLAVITQWYECVQDAPLNIGARPLNSWPAFIPIAFVFTVLCTGISVLGAFLMQARLPTPYQEIFSAPSFNLYSHPYCIQIYSSIEALALDEKTAQSIAEKVGAIHWEEVP